MFYFLINEYTFIVLLWLIKTNNLNVYSNQFHEM